MSSWSSFLAVRPSGINSRGTMPEISKDTSSMTSSFERSGWNFCFCGDCDDFYVVDALVKKHNFFLPVTILTSSGGSLSTSQIKSPAISTRIAFGSSINMRKRCVATPCAC
ncbi:hypothetical protein TNCV_112991 [Trichonephila clavipes]|nr:hypothetical protein TNCV_112991 [Trichonephila clavipes]